MADTAVGIFSGKRRGENFQRRKNPQNELELLESKRKALENLAPAYKERLMTQQGVSSEMDLDINSSYDQYVKSFEGAQAAAFADELTEGYKTQNLIAGVGNELAGIISVLGVLPGVTMEGIYESLRTPLKYNRDLMGDLTPEEDRFIQDFIEENSIAVQGGRALVIVPEVIATVAGINPRTIQRVNSFLNKRNTGQKATAAEQRQMVSDIKEVKTMLAQSRKKSITKPAPAPDDLKLEDPPLKSKDFPHQKNMADLPLSIKLGNISVTKDKYYYITKALADLPYDDINVTNVSEITGSSPSLISKVVKDFYGTDIRDYKRKRSTFKTINLGKLYPEDRSSISATIAEIDKVMKLRLKDGLPFKKIAEKTGIGKNKVLKILRTGGNQQRYTADRLTPKTTPDQVNQRLENLATYISKLEINEPLKLNSKIVRQMKEDLQLPNIEREIQQLNKEVMGTANRGLKLPKGQGFINNLKNLPKRKYVVEELEEVGYSPRTIQKIKDVEKSVKEVSTTHTNFEHALPQVIINNLDLPRKYKLIGERTSSFLNNFKSQYDRQMANLVKRYQRGAIDLSEYNKQVNALRDEVREATDGYEIGYVKFVGDKAIPVTPQKSALTRLGDLGRGTTGIINYFKNIKHHNALVKNYNKNPNDPKFSLLRTLIKKSRVPFKEEKELAKSFDKIKNFTTVEEFVKFFSRNKKDPFFKALLTKGGVGKKQIVKKGKLIPISAVTTAALTNALKAEDFEDEIQDRIDKGNEFEEGDFVVKNLQDLESVKALQEQIKQKYNSEIAVGIRDATDKKFEEIQE